MATSEGQRPAGLVLRRRGDVLVALLGVAIYLPCAAVASSGDVPQLEQDVFHLVNGLPDWVLTVAYPAQLLGVVVVPLVLAIPAAWLRRWRLALALVLLSALKYVVEFGLVKRTVNRERPFTSLCMGDPSCGQFRDVPLQGPSFVSGHAIIAAALVVILLPYLSRRASAVLVLVLAAGVALGRVYLGAHNPLDVVGGLAVGVAIGSLLNLAVGIPAEPAGRDSDLEPAD